MLWIALGSAACGGASAPTQTARDASTDRGASIDSGTVDVAAVLDSSPPSDVPFITPGNPGASDVQLSVRGDLPRHSISPYIYGWNTPTWTSAHGVTVTRIGGDRMTAYNWVNNASNAGSDYEFQNDDYLCSDAGCNTPGEVTLRAVDDAFSHHASIVLTVPMAGYVAADTLGGGDVRNSGPTYLMTRFDQSLPRKGAPFTLTPTLTGAMVFQDEYVNWVESTFPTATRSGQEILYQLDNEPDLWASTHAEIHPSATTYAELFSLTTAYASAIKSVAPDALVLGPVSYGWSGYVNLQNAPDAAGRDFLDTYLDAIAMASSTAGMRLVDSLDLHWYPEATGGGVRITADTATADVADARVQAPRSLWDATYTETSWITADSTMAPIALIPRMQSKIAAHWPGTMLSFSEYYYGGGADISGGVAEADVLGILGREGVYLAEVWHEGSTDDAYPYAGMAMFTDYDGAGGHFGSVSVAATASNDATAAVYASSDPSTPGTMVLVVINRTTAPTSMGITVTDTVAYHHAAVSQLTSASSAIAAATGLTAVATNAFLFPAPARSVSTLVLTP